MIRGQDIAIWVGILGTLGVNAGTCSTFQAIDEALASRIEQVDEEQENNARAVMSAVSSVAEQATRER